LGKNTRQIFFVCVWKNFVLTKKNKKNICFNKGNDYCTFIFKKKQKLNYGCLKKNKFSVAVLLFLFFGSEKVFILSILKDPFVEFLRMKPLVQDGKLHEGLEKFDHHYHKLFLPKMNDEFQQVEHE
jgi:hypothetical protein